MKRIKIWSVDCSTIGSFDVPADEDPPKHIIFCNELYTFVKMWNVYMREFSVLVTKTRHIHYE